MAFPPNNTRITVGIIDNTVGGTFGGSLPNTIQYSQDMGDIEKVVGEALNQVLKNNSPPVAGAEGNDFLAYADVFYEISKVDGLPYRPESFGPPTASVCNTRYPVLYQQGQWMPKSAHQVPTFNPYMAFAVPGLKWVEVNAIVDGSRYTISSENGTPYDCSLARGGGNYVGPNVAYMANLAFPSSPTAKKVTGSYKIFLSEDRTIWKEYNLANGELVAQSDKQLVVASDLKLLITPAQVVRVASGERNSSTSAQAFQLEVLGGTAGKTVTIQYSEDFVLWQTLTVLPSTDSAKFVDTGGFKARFYRAKLE